MSSKRLLDIVVPSYNRPQRLFTLLTSFLQFKMPGVFLVVIDDGSQLVEYIAGIGRLSTKEVCEYFNSDSIVYIRNAENIGLPNSWLEYYSKHCHAKYTMSAVDKDILLGATSIINALQKMEADDSLCMVLISILQQHRGSDIALVNCDYNKMSGAKFISNFVNDSNLQRCVGYSIKRVSHLKQAGVPNSLHLSECGLDDAFGIDIDLALQLATMGNVDFESAPHVKLIGTGGATELYPLTFAYTYYQYAKRVIRNLQAKNMISKQDSKIYLKNWLLLILRGLVVSYRHVHGTEKERGISRIGGHLKIPIHIYLILESIKFFIMPSAEMRELYLLSIKLSRKVIPKQPALDTAANATLENLFIAADVNAVEKEFLATATAITILPGITIQPNADVGLRAALFVESMSASSTNITHLLNALEVAEELLHRAIQASPFWVELHRALGRNLWFQGRFEQAIEAFATGEKLRDEMALMAGWPVNSAVYLPRNCTEVIGLMGHIDSFVKYKILTKDPRPYYLLTDLPQVINKALLEYWQEHITLVTDPNEILKHSQQEYVYGVNWNWIMPKHDSSIFIQSAISDIQKYWHTAALPPLLHLHQQHQDILLSAFSKWGMHANDRYVCLHIRSSDFYGAKHESAQLFRNTAIEDYYPLICMLTEMNIWVIRMGDPSMPPLDLSQCGNSKLLIDYAISAEKSAELDVALCANCELYISTNSGLRSVANSFGRPVVGVNYQLSPGLTWNPNDIFIPQLYFSKPKGRILALDEILGTNLIHCNHNFLLEREGISLLANDPEDIVETVREALDPTNYRVSNEILASKVSSIFNKLNQQYNCGIVGKFGRYFAEKYASELVSDADISTTKYSLSSSKVYA